MSSRTLARARFGAAVAIAFASGIVFASGFDLTRFGYAQSRSPAAKPTVQEVKPISDASNAFVSIAEHVTPSVVSIQAERDAKQRIQRSPRRNGPPGLEDFFQQFDPRSAPAEASGSGFIVSKDGYILTNNHVVEDFDRLNVTLTDHRVFKAKVVGRDPTTDVAVIKIDGKDLPTATLGNDENARVGEWVLAIGNPLGLDFTVTAGIVSAKGRGSAELQGLNRDAYAITDFIQTDAAINPGNSGGPLVNARGEVIGINSAIASQTGYYSGYGFAIPITLAKQVMDDIVEHGRVRRAVIGVQISPVSPEDASVAGLKNIAGVLVGGYSDDKSPARAAGLEAGDVIIAADGKPIDRVSTLQRIIRSHEPGETVTVDVMRYGTKKTFKVKLAEAPSSATVASRDNDDDNGGANGSVSYDKIGVSVEAVSPEFRSAKRLGSDRDGVRVTDIDAAGPARGRLFQNDVITAVLYPTPRKEIHSVADLQSVLSRTKDGDIVSLQVFNPDVQGAATRVVNIRVGGEK
ncbi:MAG TPA: Do family serine endopeptidase [Gemmatimonadaceae bacterium]|nr:Do family serine endopeptidase [Gemmatimonadaceae bacterium]